MIGAFFLAVLAALVTVAWAMSPKVDGKRNRSKPLGPTLGVDASTAHERGRP